MPTWALCYLINGDASGLGNIQLCRTS
ncbi:DUF6926 domain-containing protein [Bacteroides caecimuris]